jgi:transaldolase/glucose-6-phosphate isomerase
VIPAPIAELRKLGQSLWLDNIRRQLITSGELAKLRDEGISGVTSNPTIFQKAVSGSNDYDEALVRLVAAGREPEDILWDLMLEDIQAAADVFRPVYDGEQGRDGFVSIEVSPQLAYDTDGTVAMARSLRARSARPNVMVKIPATREGLPAIRTMIGEGANINVTLTFSVDRYADVVEAFIAGLEDLRQKGGDLSRVASVASFFVSRVDTKIDKLLDEIVENQADPKRREQIERLRGKAGIANSKMAYQRFKELHSGPRWETLASAGARVQRCLWASTSTKDPRYPDTMYLEELIGPDTVDTVPPATLAAFREHGEARRSLDENVDLARRQLAELAELGIDLAGVTAELEDEGVKLFSDSFVSLRQAIEEEAKAIQAGRGPRLWYSLGPLQPAIDDSLGRLDKEEVPRRLWAKDATLWSRDPAKLAEIPERMGWLNVAEKMVEQAPRLMKVAEEGRAYTDVVLLGMGGSSLCPDVLRHTFGHRRGYPVLYVLDTTDPAMIAGLERRLKPGTTLFIVASKSGDTTETLSHFAYFWSRVQELKVADSGHGFAAITDPGSPLDKLATDHGFRWIFRNPPDIGGRYSALSYFGLVPGALMGASVEGLLDRATEMAHSCDASVPAAANPGVWLGAVMGELARMGRDKLTLIVAPQVATFGYWVEQLIAESTGKQGTGIVPVEGETLGRPEAYAADRLFVRVRMHGDPDDPAVNALERAGHPVVTITLRDKLDLGGEFLRWEIATAVAGSILGIDPFDQPNVQESKDNTRKVLAQYEAKGRLPVAEQVRAGDSEAGLRELLGHLEAGRSYLALMAYTARTAASEVAFNSIRSLIRDGCRVATTAGYGPRFLHSTGQLMKGGPPTGVFLQIVDQDARDVPIPGQPYTFSVLKHAQSLGDLQSLKSRGYPVLRVDLGRSPAAGWRSLALAVESALR